MTNIRNALMQASGTAAAGGATYVEDVFSTHLYTGNGSNGLAIDNGIDLAGEGGLVWMKGRTSGGVGSDNNILATTEQGLTNQLSTDLTNGNIAWSQMQSFDSDGFTLTNGGTANTNAVDYVSWTFRKQEGFFDVVKFSTTGGGGTQAVSHSLGSIPGMIIIKKTSGSENWFCWHKGITDSHSNWWRNYGFLDTNGAFNDFGSDTGIASAPSSTAVTFGSYFTNNTSDYVMYVFAEGGSDDQKFGDDGDEAIIKTGAFQSSGSGSDVNLGFEPQWVLVKPTSSASSWHLFDTMRGMPADTSAKDAQLFPDTSGTENTSYANQINPNATGFHATHSWWGTLKCLYVAIRRGPMKEPSAGTDVLDIRTSTSSGSPAFLWNSLPFPPDWAGYRAPTDDGKAFPNSARLIQGKSLATRNTDAAQTSSNMMFDAQDSWFAWGSSGISGYYSYAWRRYPKVFDVVVYSGNGSPSIGVRNGLSHNLGVAPELIIHKGIDTTTEWQVGATPVAKGGYLNLTNSFPASFTPANEFTATTFDVDGWISENGNNVVGEEYVCFLFASLDGISKVGTYTGTGNDLNVTGLGAAARFVMIKRTDGTGDWFVFDSAMGGIVDGNDQYFRMNVGAAPVTGTDYIDPHSSGFTITSSAPAALNASGGTYLYLAFA